MTTLNSRVLQPDTWRRNRLSSRAKWTLRHQNLKLHISQKWLITTCGYHVLSALVEGSWADNCSWRCSTSDPRGFFGSNFWLGVSEFNPLRGSLAPGSGQKLKYPVIPSHMHNVDTKPSAGSLPHPGIMWVVRVTWVQMAGNDWILHLCPPPGLNNSLKGLNSRTLIQKLDPKKSLRGEVSSSPSPVALY